MAHLYAASLDTNGLLKSANDKIGKEIIIAIYRYTQLNYEYIKLCDAFEVTHISFIPLKGSLLRQCYPECIQIVILIFLSKSTKLIKLPRI